MHQYIFNKIYCMVTNPALEMKVPTILCDKFITVFIKYILTYCSAKDKGFFHLF